MDEVSFVALSVCVSVRGIKKSFMPESSSEMESIVWPRVAGATTLHATGWMPRLLSNTLANTQVPHLQDARLDPRLSSTALTSLQSIFNVFIVRACLLSFVWYCVCIARNGRQSANYLLIEFQKFQKEDNRLREFLSNLWYQRYYFFLIEFQKFIHLGKKRSVD